MFKTNSGAKIKINNKEYELISNGVNKERYLKLVAENNIKTFYLSGTILDNIETVFSYSNAIKIRDWLTEMIDFAEENKEVKKESAAMSKEYSFSEMIKEYENGYKGQFKRTGRESVAKIDIEIFEDSVVCVDGRNNFPITIGNMKCKYVKIDREVPVHEAIKALKEGKPIYFMNGERKISFNNIPENEDYKILIKDITTRKWFVVE